MAEVKVENSDEEVAEINKSAEFRPRKRPNSIDSDQSGEGTSPDFSDQPLDCHITPPPAHQQRFSNLPKKTFSSRCVSNTCSYCKKTFSCGSLLRVHLRVHTGERPYVCSICQRAFSQSGSLKRHKLIHVEDSDNSTSNGQYNCNVCDKQLTSASGLERHLMLHLNYKPYGCSICGKRFTNSSVLMAHRRVHTGEKPFKCEVCHKTFTQNGTLKRHKMVHTGEKPFACNLCDWRGTQLFLLMQHKRSHHFGEKPYSCTICHKTFSFSSSLQLHQRTHTGEKPYKCEYCSKSFTQNGSLNRHKLNNHNIMTKRQWQNRCFQEQVQVQPENLSNSVFHKIESHFPAGALPPITATGRLPETAAGLMLKAAAPNISPPAFADMSHLTRYMQAYQPHITRPPHPQDFSPTAGSQLDNAWAMSKPGYTETEPISPESSVKHGGDSTPSRQSVQSPASLSETQAPPEDTSVTSKDHPMGSPVYSKDMPMNYEHDNPDYPGQGGHTPMGIDYSSDKKDHDRPSVMYLPHEYVNDIGQNSSRPGSNSDKFNSSQSAESGYLSPQTNTDTDDNSTVQESHTTAVVRTASSFPRITDPIKRLGHKSRSGSREKLTLDQTISRLSGRASVEDRASRFSIGQTSMEDHPISQVSGRSSVDSTTGSINTPMPEPIPTTAMMSPTRVGSPKALNTFTAEELLNNLFTRGKIHYCEHCQVFFIDAAMYFIHRGTHDPHQPYKCSLCSYTARDRYDFSSHFLEHK